MIENMKAKEIDYLGVIPSSWIAKRIKYCADICNGGEYSDIVLDEGGYSVIGSGGEFARASKYCYFGKSVLLGRKGTIDKPLYIDDSFWCVDTMFYTKMKSITNAKYLYYCSLNIRFDYYVTSTALPSMTQRDLSSEKIALPPLSEQILIANFLDEQCGKIDSVITDLEKQIKILVQYKKSLITETVTKGLDKTVPMKDSGIDIVGDVVKNWKIKRLKYLCNISTGNSDTQDADLDGEYLFYVRSPIIEKIRKFDFDGEAILMAGDGVGAGKVFHLAKGKFGCHQRVYIISDFKLVIPKFLFYYIRNFFSIEVEKGSAKSTVDSIRLPMLQNFLICIPSKEEQTQISNYLDNQCSRIDSIIESKKKQLTKITEHKKSLIYEYVTGKKRVKGVITNGN